MTRKQAEAEFKRAMTSYQASGSRAARKRLTRALLKVLKAGGKVGFTKIVEVAA